MFTDSLVATHLGILPETPCQSLAISPPCTVVHACCLSLGQTAQGRIFIDRDPQHFGLILNFLRDGTCVLPTDMDVRRQILQEADFYQLESLRAFIMHVERRDLQTAQDLRACIATRLEVLLSCIPTTLSCKTRPCQPAL